jgi:quinol monooxygenase YgiN
VTRRMLFLHAKPGAGAELLRVLERLGVLAVASEQAGFLGIEVAASVDDADELVIVESWASQELYERWSEGPVAAGWLRQIEGLLTKPPSGRVYRIVEAVR